MTGHRIFMAQGIEIDTMSVIAGNHRQTGEPAFRTLRLKDAGQAMGSLREAQPHKRPPMLRSGETMRANRVCRPVTIWAVNCMPARRVMRSLSTFSGRARNR